MNSRDTLLDILDTRDPGIRLWQPGDPDWDQARRAWNLAVDQHPAAVAAPTTTDGVAELVRLATRGGLRVAPQSTGHGAATIGDLADTILVRTSRLQQVRVDTERVVARVGGGACWQQVTDAARPHGLAGLFGTDDSVGVAGYTLGGGVSWFARRNGLACSAVTGAEVVTADGCVRWVDADSDPELFWALRGGGGGFGIVTALEFRLFPIVEVTAGALWFPLERAAEALATFSRWTAGLDDLATTAIRLMRVPDLPSAPEPLRGKAFVIVQGTIAAPAGIADALLAPLRRLAPMMDTFRVTTSDAISAVHLAPPGPAPTSSDGMILSDLPDAAVEQLLGQAGPESTDAIAMVELRQLTGAIGRPDPAGGALDHLPGRFLLMAGNVTPTPGDVTTARRQLAGLGAAMSPWRNSRDYLNFRELAAPASRFFDDATRARLTVVKDRVDPDRVIQSNHPTWDDVSPGVYQ